MNFKNLIIKHKDNWESIERIILKEYPDEDKNITEYKKVFYKLLTVEPEKSPMQIHIERQLDAYDEKYYTHVFGKDGTLNKDGSPGMLDMVKNNEWGNKEVAWALDGMEWKKWLGSTVFSEVFDKYSELQILAHCLYELTFVGYDINDIPKFKAILNERIKEIQEHQEDLSSSDNFLEDIDGKS